MDVIYTAMGAMLPRSAEFTVTNHLAIARRTPRLRPLPVRTRQGAHRTIRKLNA